MKKNGDTIQAFTNAIQKGMDYVNSHTSEEIAAVIAPQFTETDEATVAKIVERYKSQDTWKNDTIFEQESFDLLKDILKESDQLKTEVPYSDLVTTDYSKNAVNK